MKKISIVKREKIYATISILPAIIIFIAFTYYPLIMTLKYSFTDWNGYSQNFNYVGLENFKFVLTNNTIKKAFGNTLYYAFVASVLGTVLQLIIALVLHNKFKGKGILKAIFYIPSVISFVIVALTWRNLLQYTGLINRFFILVGLDKFIVDWLGNPKVALNTLIVVNTWQYIGIGMIIFIAGLNSVPKQIYEAALIDGAEGIRKFFSITLPLIMPSFTIVSFMAITGTLKIFDLPFVLTNGGPNGATKVISMLIYETGFLKERFGRASAIGLIFFIFIALISILQLYFTRKKEVEY